MSAIYIIQRAGFLEFKIGYSKDPIRRVKELQTGSSSPLRLVFFCYCSGSVRIERSLHEYFKQRKTRESGEWFSLTFEEVVMIQIFLHEWAINGKLKPEFLFYETETPTVKSRKELFNTIRRLEADLREFDVM